MKATSQELLQTLKSTQEAGGPRATMAVVSPCSRCRNNLASPTNGFPACPRRHWDDVATQAAAAALPPPADYLLRHNKSTVGGAFENPVYIGNIDSVLVWIAAVEENREILDAGGNPVNPSILKMAVSGAGTGAFDTRYITCHHFPCVPGSEGSKWFQGGQACEGQHLQMTQAKIQQLHDDESPVSISGFVQRASTLHGISVGRSARDTNPAGT